MMNIKRILSFSELEPNWNGAGSSPISDDVIGNSIIIYDILKGYQPFISPTGRNSIQFEWGTLSNYIEVEVYSFELCIYSDMNDTEFERSISFSDINTIITELLSFIKSLEYLSTNK